MEASFAELVQDLWNLVQPYLLATLVVFALVALVRAFAAWRVGGKDQLDTPHWKLAFMVLALAAGLTAGLIGWAPPVGGEGLAGRIGSGFLVAGLAIVNRDAGTRLLQVFLRKLPFSLPSPQQNQDQSTDPPNSAG